MGGNDTARAVLLKPHGIGMCELVPLQIHDRGEARLLVPAATQQDTGQHVWAGIPQGVGHGRTAPQSGTGRAPLATGPAAKSWYARLYAS